ncbi:MAG TPA: hypothetical protein VMH05_16230 [Bryobacteraceae bacterium]|nr:hypothetical protein [Bryobacteraceae bacterium]
MAIEIRITVGPSGVSILAVNPGTQDGGNLGQVTGGVNLGGPKAGGGSGLLGGPGPGGGSGLLGGPGPGGGGLGSGALVIGPIVVDASGLLGTSQAPQDAPKSGGGAGQLAGPGPGGGSGLLAGPGPGGGGAPGAAVLVIGPIVIGAAGMVAAIPVQALNTPPAAGQK